MGGASSYLAILSICGFLAATWCATRLSRMAGVSSIVLEIATGVVLGPSVVGLISSEYASCGHQTHTVCTPPLDFEELLLHGKSFGPDLDHIVDLGYCDPADFEESQHLAGLHSGGGASGQHRRLAAGGGGSDSFASFKECLEKTCKSEVAHHCGLTPDIFTLIGHTGVAMMIFESGMHFDFDKAKIVGPKACVVAVFGTLTPFVSGMLLMMIYGYPALPDGVSVGVALAPTSVGIALRLLGEAGVLQQDFGQAIITAAFIDDILSLILFNVLFSLRGTFDVMATVVNPILGIAFMGIAIVMAVKFWPQAINKWILPRLPKKAGESKVSGDEEGLFFIMLGLLIIYGTITHFLGTHLWGCFIAGMSFACIDQEGHKGHTHHVWVRQTKRYTSWMIRIFFSCTVAFSIPVSKLLSIDSFIKGSIMGIGPCILTKVLCAPFMGRARFVIGWAMVGRAEFAYLIAQMAASANMIDEDTFSICIWALLYATISAPFVFRTLLNRYIQAEALEKLAEDARGFGLPESEDVVDLDAQTPCAIGNPFDEPPLVAAAGEAAGNAARKPQPKPKGGNPLACLCGSMSVLP